MRIKSYFAPSVQAAIALARKEFGDGVTLVTSHVASLDNRHLGEYEVVFAIEEVDEIVEVIKAPQPEPQLVAATPPPAIEIVSEPAPVFNQLLQQAILTPVPMHQDLPEKLEQIHSSLVALGLEASLVRSFMTMLKAVLPATPATPEIPTLETLEVIDEPVLASLEVAPSEPESEPVTGTGIEYVLEPVAAVIDEPVVNRVVAPVATQVIKSADMPGNLPVLLPTPALPAVAEPAAPAPAPLRQQPEPRPFLSLFEAPSRPQSRFSAAELAFMSSVSSPKEQGA